MDNGQPGDVGEPQNSNFTFDASSDGGNTETSAPSLALTSQKPATKTKKKSAWVDADDSSLSVSLASTRRLRKLRDTLAEDVVGGAQYEARLRREYERLNPAPLWAARARKKLHAGEGAGDAVRKRRRSSTGVADANMDIDEDEDTGSDTLVDVNVLLARTDGILADNKARGRGSLLEKGVLGIERLRDANISAQAEGEIKALGFHPFPRVPVLMTASSDRRVRLFNVRTLPCLCWKSYFTARAVADNFFFFRQQIDGHTNPHMLTVHVPALPLTNACFHPSGNTILLTGPRPFYYTLDLQSGQTTRSPRGLWGSFSSLISGQSQADLGMETCAFDPTGTVLAVAGRRGAVHLVDWRAGGAAQVVGSVKMNAGVKALWWAPRPQSVGGGAELMTLGADAEVYVWDVGTRRCMRRWREEGGYGTTVMSGDANGRYLAVGSVAFLSSSVNVKFSTKVLYTAQSPVWSTSTAKTH